MAPVYIGSNPISPVKERVFWLYIAFTEKQAVEIRKTGLSVIEYKYCLKKHISTSAYAIDKIMRQLSKAANVMSEVAKKFSDEITKLIITSNYAAYKKEHKHEFSKTDGKCNIDYKVNAPNIPRMNFKLPRSNC